MPVKTSNKPQQPIQDVLSATRGAEARRSCRQIQQHRAYSVVSATYSRKRVIDQITIKKKQTWFSVLSRASVSLFLSAPLPVSVE